MNAELLKLVVDWLKTKAAEKLQPKKEEKTREQLALEKIKALLATYAPRYSAQITVKEVYDKISEVVNEAEPLADAPLTERKPYQANPITANYVSKYLGEPWTWPRVIGPCSLWFEVNISGVHAIEKAFDRISYWEKGQTGDLVVLDSRVAGGYGATGILVCDEVTQIRLYVDDINTLQYRTVPKAAVLGYFRPKTAEKE